MKNPLARILLLLSLLAVATAAEAQRSPYLVVSPQRTVKVPGTVSNLSVVDGNIYCYSSDMLLVVRQQNGQLSYAEADTQFVKLDPEMDYVVRHPVSGNLFYTKRSSDGRTSLYEVVPNGTKKPKIRKVRLGGAKLSIEHPVFSKDGRYMVFTCFDRIGFGGYDLWYSEYSRGRWSLPQNMGHRINSSDDEIAPVIYGDFLIFTAKGRKESLKGYNLYATRLVATHPMGDTISMVPVGCSKLQQLPEPINSRFDDVELVVDTTHQCGYWISRRGGELAGDRFYGYQGMLKGMVMTGQVTNSYGKPLEGVEVTLLQDSRELGKMTTGAEGHYKFFLQEGTRYVLRFFKEGCFVKSEEVLAERPDEDLLIAELHRDVELSHLVLGEALYYSDLFGPGVDVELSDSGIRQLGVVASFLRENPTITAAITLRCDQTSDSSFNSLLTARRLQAIEKYLLLNVPSTTKITYQNGCGDCSSGSGSVVMSMVLSKNSIP